jgi:hypothetical protein
MAAEPGSIRHLYADWTQYRSRLVEGVRHLTDEQLAIRAGPEHAPIWALAAHVAGVRVYWLCGVLGEPGAETTPFPDPWAESGWEDDLEHPRSAGELVYALESTGTIVERVLDTWTLLRLLSHDAFHSGEISQLLGVHGLPAIDLWSRRPRG